MQETNIAQQNSPDNEPKAFHLYTGKAPVLLQIVAGLMWLGGILGIIFGAMMLFNHTLGVSIAFPVTSGIISIVFGIFEIIYGKAIFKMQRKAFKGTIILGIAVIVVNYGLYAVAGFDKSLKPSLSIFVMPIIVIFLVFIYRHKFINN